MVHINITDNNSAHTFCSNELKETEKFVGVFFTSKFEITIISTRASL